MLVQLLVGRPNDWPSIHGSGTSETPLAGTATVETTEPARESSTLAGFGFGLEMTMRKSNRPLSSSAMFATGVGQYSQPMLEREDSASPHASAQNPLAPHAELHSLQFRPVVHARPFDAQTIDTSPSQRRVPGRQSTQVSSGSHASSHTVSLMRDAPSSPHW